MYVSLLLYPFSEKLNLHEWLLSFWFTSYDLAAFSSGGLLCSGGTVCDVIDQFQGRVRSEAKSLERDCHHLDLESELDHWPLNSRT